MKDSKKRVIFSFLNHRETDGRVFYREVRHVLHEIGDNIEMVFVGYQRCNQKEDILLTEHDIMFEGYKIHSYQFTVPGNCDVFQKIRWKQKLESRVRKLLKRLKPDMYFIADVREISSAMKAFKNTETKVIYDSHEDYVRQALDYKGLKILNYFHATQYYLLEKRNLQFFEAVFCTDEFLYEKYKRTKYKAKQVYLLRNFPYYVEKGDNLPRKFELSNVLKLVYIGGVDSYRGVIETAEYVKKYNSENKESRLTFDIYGNDNKIAKSVSDGNVVKCHGWIDHGKLMQLLPREYDVGVCLWQPLPKFYRNLPIKNFDYMGVGLPILTSNFGNLRIHAEKSKAGICIDPTSYDEFSEAISVLFKPEKRKQFSENGINYASHDATFQKEAQPLIECLKGALNI